MSEENKKDDLQLLLKELSLEKLGVETALTTEKISERFKEVAREVTLWKHMYNQLAKCVTKPNHKINVICTKVVNEIADEDIKLDDDNVEQLVKFQTKIGEKQLLIAMLNDLNGKITTNKELTLDVNKVSNDSKKVLAALIANINNQIANQIADNNAKNLENIETLLENFVDLTNNSNMRVHTPESLKELETLSPLEKRIVALRTTEQQAKKVLAHLTAFGDETQVATMDISKESLLDDKQKQPLIALQKQLQDLIANKNNEPLLIAKLQELVQKINDVSALQQINNENVSVNSKAIVSELQKKIITTINNVGTNKALVTQFGQVVTDLDEIITENKTTKIIVPIALNAITPQIASLQSSIGKLQSKGSQGDKLFEGINDIVTTNNIADIDIDNNDDLSPTQKEILTNLKLKLQDLINKKNDYEVLITKLKELESKIAANKIAEVDLDKIPPALKILLEQLTVTITKKAQDNITEILIATNLLVGNLTELTNSSNNSVVLSPVLKTVTNLPVLETRIVALRTIEQQAKKVLAHLTAFGDETQVATIEIGKETILDEKQKEPLIALQKQLQTLIANKNNEPLLMAKLEEIVTALDDISALQQINTNNVSEHSKAIVEQLQSKIISTINDLNNSNDSNAKSLVTQFGQVVSDLDEIIVKSKTTKVAVPLTLNAITPQIASLQSSIGVLQNNGISGAKLLEQLNNLVTTPNVADIDVANNDDLSPTQKDSLTNLKLKLQQLITQKIDYNLLITKITELGNNIDDEVETIIDDTLNKESKKVLQDLKEIISRKLIKIKNTTNKATILTMLQETDELLANFVKLTLNDSKVTTIPVINQLQNLKNVKVLESSIVSLRTKFQAYDHDIKIVCDEFAVLNNNNL